MNEAVDIGVRERRIDLNADLGEGGPADAALLALVSSANIACGAHAGDTQIMARTVAEAAAHGVAIGAHPGYADREHFGRRHLHLPPEAVYRLVTEQISALATITQAAGAHLVHVKPHGALYNQAARNPERAAAIAQAIRDFDPSLVLVGLAGSALIEAGLTHGLTVGREAFADRRYEADGSLTPRRHPNALIHDPDEAAEQVLSLLQQGHLRTRDGQSVAMTADTLCVHGDSPAALALVQRIRQTLARVGIAVRPLGAARGSNSRPKSKSPH
ncbi:MAG: 5-oxoprolinase subunit PxpA [Candidatus Macondimonas sp.]|jgi:UPF0271 protein